MATPFSPFLYAMSWLPVFALKAVELSNDNTAWNLGVEASLDVTCLQGPGACPETISEITSVLTIAYLST